MAIITGSITLFSCNPKICKHDNQTFICNLGYRLNYLGRCLSQSLGKWNSTGFLPTYPICMLDYRSKLDASLALLETASQISNSFVVFKDEQLGEIGAFCNIAKNQMTLTSEVKQVQPSIEKAGSFNLYAHEYTSIKATDILIAEVGAEGTFNVHHSGKGVISHDANVSSEYWVVDTYSSTTINKEFTHFNGSNNILVITKPQGSSYIIGSSIEVSSPYKALRGSFELPLGQTLASGVEAENPQSICVDDLTAPVVSGTSPAAFSHLNTRTDPVELIVLDPVAGVDIGVLKITVSGNLTSQPEGVVIVSSGVDVTGGKVNIYGDILEYTIRYTPTNNWAFGEKVTVTVSGQDLAPTILGTPWTCYSPDFRNIFGDTYWYFVAAENNLPVTITAIPDSGTPYLTNMVPVRDSVDNNVFTSISFDIVDDISGVKLSTVSITIDGEEIVTEGERKVSTASILPIINGYRFSYTPAWRFDYGSSVQVTVTARDMYLLTDNTLTDAYDIGFIADSTTKIENFVPGADTSYLAETLNLGVDIYDGTYGLKDAYFIVNGAVCSGVRTTISGGLGYHIDYPVWSHFDGQGTLNIYVYAENNNSTAPVVKNDLFILYRGYKLLENKYVMRHGQKVYVSARAVNTKMLQNYLSDLYTFTTYSQPESNLPATIVPMVPWSDVAATMTIHSPTHSYGELIDIEFYIEDKAGNIFGPYNFNYTIEENPNG